MKYTTKSFKIYCLPLTKTKKEKLHLMAMEYMDFYNYSAKFQPSLPDKYREQKNPSELYTKWVKSGILRRDYLGGLEAFNAIKDACANYKSSIQNDGAFSCMKTSNIIKFENSRYNIIKLNKEFLISIGDKKKGIREITLPLKVGKYVELRNYLENIVLSQENPGAILYNIHDNSISLPLKTYQSKKFNKKENIETIIGVDRGVNNTVVLAAVRKLDKKILGIKIISGMKNKFQIKHLYNVRRHKQHSGKIITNNKIENIQDTYGHQIANEIVKFTLKYPNPIVVFEKLNNKFFRTQRSHFQAWNYGDVKLKTENKLKEKSIYIVEINPAYTSILCHRCGAIGIREGIHFMCPSCKLGSTPNSTMGQYNADINASINIALRGFQCLYGVGKGNVEDPNANPNDCTQEEIPQITSEVHDGRTTRKDVVVLCERKVERQVSSNTDIRKQPMVGDQESATQKIALFSSSYKGKNNFRTRTESMNKINISEVLSQTKF